ncbi:MAG: succinyldiaminopimelate transaminase [Spongiibacteraceae bacterium]|nr:succinyldiaminopimelate transaminase [Spongiibacteraceae bacterium]
MNPDLARLQPYPFDKLKALKAQVSAPTHLSHIALSIGEPKHQPAQCAISALQENLHKVANYPGTKGLLTLRQTISQWLTQRFQLNTHSLDPEHNVLPVNGTREALFAFAQTVIDRNTTPSPLVISPNPFYQIYEGAAYLAGATPHYLPCTKEKHFIPDFDGVSEQDWQRCQLLYLCSPGNPSGAVIDIATWKKLITLADRYNFIIASDECYSELYFDEKNPPVGLLQACATIGRNDFQRCVVFHSLSKRSNLPGLRSGFIAGDTDILKQFLLYRTYHGSAMPLQHQQASIAAWADESHVIKNREHYRNKFDHVLKTLDHCLDVQKPDAGFYLWAKTPISDTEFTQRLFAEQHITVLPGSYISRSDNKGYNPGENYIRMALVAPEEECVAAAIRIKTFVSNL